MKKFGIALLFCLVSALHAQHDMAAVYDVYNTGFYLDIADYKSTDSDLTTTQVFIQVPYSYIQFIKQGFRYNAEYTLSLKIKNAIGDSVVYYEIWDEKVAARDFEKTKSETSFNLSNKTLQLEPGNYKVNCVLEDNNSEIQATANVNITVRKFGLTTPDISDIMLISKVLRTRRGDQIIPNIKKKVTSEVTEIPFYFELYSDKEEELTLECIISDNMSDKKFKSTVTKKVSPGTNMIYNKIDNTTFSLSKYELYVNLIKPGADPVLLGRKKIFSSNYHGIPSTVKDLDKAIDQMIYIASTSSVDSIKMVDNYNDRLENYVKFWKRIDPTPETEKNEVMDEYYARVDYSNKNFNSYFEGWKSDMGWIFITLGPPDYVYRQPMAMDEKPYEIWSYYEINKTFKFMDETGFGHYRLVNPEYGDWLRYRY